MTEKCRYPIIIFQIQTKGFRSQPLRFRVLSKEKVLAETQKSICWNCWNPKNQKEIKSVNLTTKKESRHSRIEGTKRSGSTIKEKAEKINKKKCRFKNLIARDKIFSLILVSLKNTCLDNLRLFPRKVMTQSLQRLRE